MYGGANMHDPLIRRWVLTKEFHMPVSEDDPAVELDELIMLDGRISQMVAERQERAHG